MNQDHDEIISKIFNKKFKFHKDGIQELPPVDSLFECPQWTVENLQNFKDNLNQVKSKLNDKKLEVWSEHTKLNNPAGDIVSKVRGRDVKGEFVTQAWCKLYEIMSNYECIQPQNYRLKSVHFCEAPGGFIAALNHWLKLNTPDVQWDWKATTLNPYYEGNAIGDMIIDDRFIIGTLDRWDFGEDYTGNIMDITNLKKITEWSNRSVCTYFGLLNYYASRLS